jgi:hypothetical protein
MELRDISPADLAGEIIKIIENTPDWYYQGTWFWSADPEGVAVGTVRRQMAAGQHCGSTACIAGHAAIAIAPDGAVIDDGDVSVGDEVAEIDALAQRALGLSYGQAYWLFSCSRTTEQVLGALRLISEGRSEEIRNSYREE